MKMTRKQDIPAVDILKFLAWFSLVIGIIISVFYARSFWLSTLPDPEWVSRGFYYATGNPNWDDLIVAVAALIAGACGYLLYNLIIKMIKENYGK